MRLYVGFVGNSFQKNITYKVDIYFMLISKVIGIFIQIAFWYALYDNNIQIASRLGAISINDMLNYIVISMLLSTLIITPIGRLINDKIKTGEIAVDLMRPFNFILYMICETIGYNMVLFIFQFLPLLVLSLLAFKLHFPPLNALGLFMVILMNGVLINFLLEYIVGILAFWLLVTWPLRMLLRSILKVFSGMWIPLWFFPEGLYRLSEFLPFRLIYYAPLSLFLEKISIQEGLHFLFHQIIWISVLLIVERMIWQVGIRKLVIQGG